MIPLLQLAILRLNSHHAAANDASADAAIAESADGDAANSIGTTDGAAVSATTDAKMKASSTNFKSSPARI